MTPLQTHIAPLQKELGLEFHPVAQMEIDPETGRKRYVKGPWATPASWEDRPDFNLAYTFLSDSSPYMVIDIDGLFSHVEGDEVVLTTGIRLPLTLYTHTSSPRNAHLYYRRPAALMPGRAVGVVDPKVDVFTYGNVFEGHLLGKALPDNIPQFNFHPIVDFPEDHPYMALLEAEAENVPDGSRSSRLYPLSQPHRARALRSLREIMRESEGIPATPEVRKMLVDLLPRKYITSKSPDVVGHIDFNYTFVNDTAAKLSTIAELSTEEVREFLRDLIRYGFRKDPDYRGLLDKQIFATIPSREAIPTPEERVQELVTIEKARKEQLIDDSIPYLVFKTSVASDKGVGTTVYLMLDKDTLKPYVFNNTMLFTEKAMRDHASWRNVTGKNGNVTGWDPNVPMVETIESPYEPSISYNNDNQRLRINFYQSTVYVEQATPRQLDPMTSDNILFRLLRSSVRPEYLPFLLRWYAYTVYDQNPPQTVLWFASNSAGAGKTLITSTIPNLLLGRGAIGTGYKEATSGWGDVEVGKRLLAIEDVPKISQKEWAEVYGFIKKQSDRKDRLLNMKKKTMATGRIKLAISGSSNYIHRLDPDDRRFFCLEPAHREDREDAPAPLTYEEQKELDRVVANDEDYHPEIQELADYLLWLHRQPLSETEYNELRVRAPVTHYKRRWIEEALPYMQRVTLLIGTNPRELLSLIRDKGVDTFGSTESVPVDTLIETMLRTYHPGKKYSVGLPWKWFEALADHIVSRDTAWSRASLADAMGLEGGFSNISEHFWRAYKQTEMGRIAAPREGYQFNMSPEIRDEYVQILKELRDAQPDDGLGTSEGGIEIEGLA